MWTWPAISRGKVISGIGMGLILVLVLCALWMSANHNFKRFTPNMRRNRFMKKQNPREKYMNLTTKRRRTFGRKTGNNITKIRKLKVTKKLNSKHIQVFNISSLKPHSNASSLYPTKGTVWENDRIFTQLSYVPIKKPTAIKIIVMPFSSIPHGRTGLQRKTFTDLRCLVNMCSIIGARTVSDIQSADLVMLTHTINNDIEHHEIVEEFLSSERRPGQIWAMETREPATHTSDPFNGRGFNWTITYSPFATITYPFGKLYQLTEGVSTIPQRRNWAKGRNGTAVFVTSHCRTRSNRLEYITELAKHIKVDVYGHCGIKVPECRRDQRSTNCTRSLTRGYKFYLSFENTNCESYITEKYFFNALSHDILPIVMGPRAEYYNHVSPPNSFIHVEDFDSPKELAKYLHKLNNDDDLYNSYFRWKGAWGYLPEGTVYCRICAMLHAPIHYTVTDTDTWKRSEKCRGPTHDF